MEREQLPSYLRADRWRIQLLENSSHHAWILHSHGGKHTLLAIGPDNITSEQHKVLLAAQCQILVRIFVIPVAFITLQINSNRPRRLWKQHF
jgi:hypothetical protein